MGTESKLNFLHPEAGSGTGPKHGPQRPGTDPAPPIVQAGSGLLEGWREQGHNGQALGVQESFARPNFPQEAGRA